MKDNINNENFTISSGFSCNGENHCWLYTADVSGNPPEGTPCCCGAVLFHREKCKECGSNIIKPIRVSDIFAVTKKEEEFLEGLAEGGEFYEEDNAIDRAL